MKELKWSDNWGGGKWNDLEPLKNPQDYDFYLNSGNGSKAVNVQVRKTFGVDYDHGHQYNWNNFEIDIVKEFKHGTYRLNSKNLNEGYSLCYLLKQV